MYSLNEISAMSIYNIMGIILRWKKFKYMLEINILRKSIQNNFGCPEGLFLRIWVSKQHPDALLDKNMLPLLCV